MKASSGSVNATDKILAAAQAALDNKTKPVGSLGILETLATQLASVQQTLAPVVDPARIIVFAADHGVTVEGVSAFPAEVTVQMMSNFAAGGAAVCVLGATAGATLEIVDVGVDGDVTQLSNVVHAKVGHGTRNLAVAAAMSHEELESAMRVGHDAILRASTAGMRCVGLGEMGIGNTTSAAILTGLLCHSNAKKVTGRGTGLNDSQLPIKQQVVRQCLARLSGLTENPLECLRQAGGFEIAALVGAMLAAAESGMPVIVDGFIVTAAALVACRLNPGVREHLFFSHLSAESGHQLALKHLRAQPILQLEMRLGEGSATALALPVLRSAAAILREMASFSDAGVSTATDE